MALTSQQLDSIIETANRKSAGVRNRQYAKRSSDAQMLDHVLKNARIAVDDYRAGRSIETAMKDLAKAVALVEKRA